MKRISMKGVEVLSSTEQVIVFTVKHKGKELGVPVSINIMYYESKNEEAWILNDNIIQKNIELLLDSENYYVK
jgi:hypothetical protein